MRHSFMNWSERIHFSLFLLLVGRLVTVAGQFPVACLSNATQPSAVCCPAPDGSSAPCGGPRRGACVAITTAAVDDEPPSEELRNDDRLAWPLRFFAFGCRCLSPYWGADCGAAAPARPRLRKNALSLSAEERRLLRQVFVASKNESSGWAVLNISGSNNGDPSTPDKLSFVNVSVYDFLVYLHLYSSRSTLLQPVMPDRAEDEDDGEGPCPRSRHRLDFAHRGPAFLPWHRHYLLLAEAMFGLVAKQRFGVEEFALPYWDWTGKSVCDVCIPDLVGPVGNATADDSNPDFVGGDFANFRAFCPRRSRPGACHVCDPGSWAFASEAGEPLWRAYNAELVGEGGGGLPSAAETAYLLVNASRYDSPPYNQSAPNDSFRNLLEGFVNSTGDFSADRPFMHNLVHSYMRGTWLDVALSPNDPLFWLHHCFVDKLFELWLRSGPGAADPELQLPVAGTPIGHSRQSNLVPFFPPVTTADRFVKSDGLGYAYDTLLLETNLDALALRGVLTAPAGGTVSADAPLSGWDFRLLSLIEFLILAACLCLIGGWACFIVGRRRRQLRPYREVDGPIDGGGKESLMSSNVEGEQQQQRQREDEEETPLIADKRSGKRQLPIYV